MTPLSDWIVSVVLSTVPLSSDVELGKEAWRDMKEKAQACSRRMGSQSRVGQQLVQHTALDDMDDMEWSFSVVHANVVQCLLPPWRYCARHECVVEQARFDTRGTGGTIRA